MDGGISSDQNSFHRTGKDLYRKTHRPNTGVNEMNADQILNEIREANLSYLMLAQSLIRSDREQALYRLGISEESAALIGLLTPAQMMKIAAGNTLLCRFRMDDDMVWGLLTNHGKSAANDSTSRLHASILLAGRHQEAA
jgi:flagellar transcriptional activator FlhD